MKIWLLTIALLTALVGAATAAEPTQSLLNELVQPHLTGSQKASEGLPQRQAGTLYDDGTALFTLE